MKSRLFCARRLLAVAGTVAVSASALAVPPTMPAIDLPVDSASIVTQVAAAGGAMLILVIGVKIGFSLIRKLAKRATSAV